MIDIDREKKRHAQRALQLICTRAVAQMIIEARQKNLSTRLMEELFALLKTTAIFEWGEGTVIDDFSKPEFVVIKKGLRVDEIRISLKRSDSAA